MNQNKILTRLSFVFLVNLCTIPALQAKDSTAEQKTECFQIVNSAQKFTSIKQEKQFRDILRITRCVKCPNQSLESSQAGLANDLRTQICLKVLSNISTKQIIDDLVGIYGDYILYDPRFKPGNYALWLLPLIILVIGLVVLFIKIKSRTPKIHQQFSASEKSKLQDLLKDNNEERK